MRDELITSIEANQTLFGLDLDKAVIERLADYYELVQQHNPLLHLVAPCPPAEFATRHILESLTMLEHLAPDSKFADVGSGGGLPAIPCLIARQDLNALLIESKEKKAQFLHEAVESLGLTDRASVENKQFLETDIAGCNAVSCRALDKFTDRLPRLIKWAGRRQLLLFGGEALPGQLKRAGGNLNASPRLMPLSGRRYLYVA